ncbi:MoaD/ThiS family protein [Rhizobium sp. L1K21]|uniref:MoaD/ThiS family protein n=1 Tax=Rhizobium sp. L1K21 TaxID=2954933 RepID=UPI002093FBD9|nr:MoaD/ThiS family protein [Rhizobium sp. L1K21]MCO6186635.1 MoaD/ThiS family protein [Rhizobium sp. L1K21]
MAECKVHTVLPDALVRLFPEAPRRLDLAASTVDELFEALDSHFPGMAECLRDNRPSIRKHINVFVRGERAVLSTPLETGETVYILTAISGG